MMKEDNSSQNQPWHLLGGTAGKTNGESLLKLNQQLVQANGDVCVGAPRESI